MKKLLLSCFIMVLLFEVSHAQAPRIVNIVNFIRLLEPRDSAITEDVLYQTVVHQIALMRRHHLRGTFLLQYDALMDSRYQNLLKSLPPDSFEIGAWWEIPQPLVGHASMKWRGRYPWDWRANIGFSTGYSQPERERLIDTYMKDFKRIFGYYPKTVASWFIDAYSLNYMYQKYHITASANCKDQFGTDGYTLWGGYWNQAYYPSKVNAYMPAQHPGKQIPVPVFRMLGSDPIRQYDNGRGQERQGVVTLEPVYPHAGGDSVWVNWFMKQFVQGASMAFAYTQAGQENSFTWKAMAKGLKLQFALFEKLRNEGKIKVQTLSESGQWFKKQFQVTPPTSVTALEDVAGGDKKTIWYDSRFYRANLFWKGNTLGFRDIHLFDENVVSPYFSVPATSNECQFLTLPFVDGFLWSDEQVYAGLKFKVTINGKTVPLLGENPVADDSRQGVLKITWRLKNIPGDLEIEFLEKEIVIFLRSSKERHWFLTLEKAKKARTPFKKIARRSVAGFAQNTDYTVFATPGMFSGKPGGAFTVVPENNKITLRMAR